MNSTEIEQLISSEDIRVCAACGELSAYSWRHATAKSSSRLSAEKGEIAHIGAASCFEWECGHCGANNAFEDAAILDPCYTHEED